MLTGGGLQMTSHTLLSYPKSFKTVDEQIELLKSRGMLFQDEIQAKNHLLNLNYYRLSGYWLPFKNRMSVLKQICISRILSISIFLIVA